MLLANIHSNYTSEHKAPLEQTNMELNQPFQRQEF